MYSSDLDVDGAPARGGFVTPGRAVRDWWKASLRTQGRTSRSGFWWVALFLGVVFVVLIGALFAIGGIEWGDDRRIEYTGAYSALTAFVAVLAFLSPLLLVNIAVRRFHDSGVSGWWLGAALGVPFLAELTPLAAVVIPLLVLLVLLRPTMPEGDKYGPPQ